jgi:hypothetical protein
MQIDVGEKRRDDATLWCPGRRARQPVGGDDTGFEPAAHQPDDLGVIDDLPKCRRRRRWLRLSKNPSMSNSATQRSPWAMCSRALASAVLGPRLGRNPNEQSSNTSSNRGPMICNVACCTTRSLHRGNAHRPRPAVGLGDLHPPDRRRLIALLRQQPSAQARKLHIEVRPERSERLAIYARRSPIRLDLGERGSQVVLGALSVGDAVPSSFAPVGRSPWPSATGTAASASHRTSVDADPSAPLPGRRFATRSRSDPSPDTAALLGLRAARRRRIESPGITPALSLLRSV